ncbi:TenA family transcriptional regulator [Alloalcanivorax mobilis]|uniref:TenA family transcriptional regulator n=1 Tax=Alloalcanivorax mobilis TaxID=2019569 RepID=UPI000B5B2A75|nr:iron-containing redox enzyme family protein [Alloalcanivorax mobilis]ASK33988.1 TENA/THI-4 domain protein [Alcanivorax sp. N3-2A]|tara:strand:+ start:14375 stop:15145 length:771 start_codon:yes stop_codon:yes gene_type:complete
MAIARYKQALELTPHAPWAQRFWDALVPLKDRVAGHPLFQEMGEGALSLPRFRDALLHFYPLVEHFPKYMGLALAKTRPGLYPGHEETRNWLIGNIKVEQRHAYWYQDWAAGFGLALAELEQVRPPAAMNAINHYLWDVGHQGSLDESIAATNLAVEWATGEWSQHVVSGMQHYAEQGQASITRHTLAWLRAHASYDDAHPHEAMELVKRLATDEPARQRAFAAAQRGLEYYLLALDDCYQQGEQRTAQTAPDLGE